MTLLSFGEVLWDITPEKRSIGGAPLNFGVHFARHGYYVNVVSTVGDDEPGREIVRFLDKNGVETDLVRTNPNYPTGTSIVSLDDNGVPTFDITKDVAYDRISLHLAHADSDIMYFGTLALRNSENIDALQEFLNGGYFLYVVADMNIRPPYISGKVIDLCFRECDIIKMSLEDLEHVKRHYDIHSDDLREICDIIHDKYNDVMNIVITMGEKGSWAVDYSRMEECFCPAVPTEVVSTVGAGDAFFASYVYHYSNDEDLKKCLEYATRLASFVVSREEAIPDYDIADLITE